MPSTYSSLLRIELQASGENDAAWGDKTNNNLNVVLEPSIAGAVSVVLSDADKTLTTGFGVADEARNAILLVTGTLTAQRSVIVPNSTKTYVVRNATTGGFAITVKTSGGVGVSIVNGASAYVFCDGAAKVELGQTPTADGSITPLKVDQTSTYAWRFNGAFGLNRAQPFEANYGAVSFDGVTGSYLSLYTGGAKIGTMSATADVYDFSALNKPITFTTNNVKRFEILNNGDVKAVGAFSANTAAVTGNAAVGSLTATNNISAGGSVTAVGFNGLTKTNITTGLGFTPVQQGTGSSQNSSFAVKIGWDSTNGKLRGQVESTDLGEFVFGSTANTTIPAGTIIHTARSTPPEGWLKANGATVSRTQFAALFSAIGTQFGAGNGSTTFQLPDLRGEFLRGWDDSRGLDTGRQFGTVQGDQNHSHSHTGTTTTDGDHTHSITLRARESTGTGVSDSGGALTFNGVTNSAGAHSHGISLSNDGGSEARPRNVSMLVCIKT